MSIPTLLWRDYSDGITMWKCLACGKGVHFSCGCDAVLGENVGRLCTWCGVAWTSVIQEEQATRRTRAYASWNYELEQRRREADNDAYWAGRGPVWFILRRPNRACDYHDDDFMNSGRLLEDVEVDSLANGTALKALALLRLCRAHGVKQGCTCEYTCDYYTTQRRR
jgi:hypothetical protein